MKKRIMLPSSSSLFHFTRKSSVFKKILKNGLMYFESVEYCPNDDISANLAYKNNGIYIIPMICFCDIPISRTLVHRKTYGNYAIGFNKEYLRTKLLDTINPVNYVSNPMYAYNLAILKQNLDTKIQENSNRLLYDKDFKSEVDKECKIIHSLLSYFKPYEYYDEREWRAILPEKNKWGSTTATWFGNNSTIIEHIKAFRKITKATNIYLSFTSGELANAISHVIVPKEDDINKFVEYILKEQNQIFGCTKVSKEERIVLISKITSFERIENDY